MDVGALFKGAKGKGKDKGKTGKGVPKFTDACNICRKVGHKKDECWFKDSKAQNTKGKEAKGKGNSKDG